jgi:putative PEP-CTERM system histidine kinase
VAALQIILWSGACLAIALAVRIFLKEKVSIATLAFVLGLVLLAVDSAFTALSFAATDPEQALRWYRWRFIPLAFTPGIWLAFSVTYARGNFESFWRRWLPIIAVLCMAVPAVALLFQDELFSQTKTGLHLGGAGRVVHVCLVVGATAVLMNVERTFRAAVGLMRWQLKFMVIGLATLFLVRIYTSTQFLIFSVINPALDTLNAAALAICCVLGFVSLRRARGFALDLYPSPTLVYRSFAVLLVGGYLFAIGVLAKAIAIFGGSSSFSFQAFLLLIALVLLGLLSFSDRVRLTVKRFVSQHLRKPVYDVRKLWRTFSEATAGRVEEGDLCRVAVRWLSETFEVLSATIWLVPQRGGPLLFGASTALSEKDADLLIQPKEQVTEPLERLQELAAPIDIDANRHPWLEVVRQWHPAKFAHGGNRVCIPIISGNELTGILIIGDRVAGVPFSLEEMDLIKCVADQLATDLVRIRLSRKLAEAKEMQAFQTMATFFVHDLKNTAWTLSLLVDNLRTHFERPEFREEAVRSLSKSVTRINELVGRISSLRHELKMNTSSTDVNALIESALKEFAAMSDVTLVKSMGTVPPVEVDKEQIQKVLTNLLVNAREASRAGAEIRLSTEQQNGHVIISVQDDGCGISPEFLKQQLFKPFQSTKKKGIGIGMFQSKMIVEAHGGRIEVQSQQGEGTTFRIVLPLPGGTN